MRDYYRTRVVTAEDSVLLSPTPNAYQHLRELRSRIDQSEWWKTNSQFYGTHDVRCARYADVGTLTYRKNPPLAMLHAFAHHMVLATDEEVPHGPKFAQAYLAIVKRFLGQDVRDRLNAAFLEHKVKTRTWSPEAKAGAKKRYAKKELTQLLEDLK